MRPHLFLIPGLGADRDLFYPQHEKFGDQLTVIEEAGGEGLWQHTPSMSKAADVFASRLASEIPTGGNYVLGGMSFGGSLAVEIAKRLARNRDCPSPKMLVLIAANRTAETISSGFRINRAVGSKLPRAWVRKGLGWAARLFARREGLDSGDRERLSEMAARADLDQLMWGAKAIAEWDLCEQDAHAIGVPIQQLHGRHDWVIPITPKHVTETIEDGKHLITWTHRQQVNRWLAERLS